MLAILLASIAGVIAGTYSGIRAFPEEVVALVEALNDLELAETDFG